MANVSVRPDPVTSERAGSLERAGEIAPFVRERAEQTEAERRIAADVIERIRAADLFRIMQPRAYGGFEYGFDVMAQVTAVLGRGCGSTAWVVGLGICHQWLAATFQSKAQDEFGRPRRHCHGFVRAGR